MFVFMADFSSAVVASVPLPLSKGIFIAKCPSDTESERTSELFLFKFSE
jgi:hypothetical protein